MFNQSKNIIQKFGGAPAVARALKMSIPQVYKWTYPKKRGGTDGLIPARHQISIYTHARNNGIDLKPDDFFEGIDQGAHHDTRP